MNTSTVIHYFDKRYGNFFSNKKKEKLIRNVSFKLKKTYLS